MKLKQPNKFFPSFFKVEEKEKEKKTFEFMGENI